MAQCSRGLLLGQKIPWMNKNYGSRLFNSAIWSKRLMDVKMGTRARGDFGIKFTAAGYQKNKSWWDKLKERMKGFYERVNNFFEYEIFTMIQGPAAVHGILWSNVAIFAAYRLAFAYKDSDTMRYLQYHFCNYPGASLKNSLSCTFFHTEFFHLLMNMFLLMSSGSSLCRMMGPVPFLSLYLVSGFVSSLVQKHNLSRNAVSYGASGAVYAVVAAQALFFPRIPVLLYGIIPMKNWQFLALLIGLDLFSSRSSPNSNVGHSAHISGLACGAAYWLLKTRL